VDLAARTFRVDDDLVNPDICIDVVLGQIGREPTGELILDSGSGWHLHRDDDHHVFRFLTSDAEQRPYKLLRLSARGDTGEIVLHRPLLRAGCAVNPLSGRLDAILLHRALAVGRGLIVHSCGIVLPSGAGLLFVGKSGAGKSTTAKLWGQEPGVQVLSDDRIILRREDGRLWMYGTPWHSSAGYCSPGRAPLSGILFLRHGPENRLKPVAAAAAAVQMLTCSFVPLYSPSGLEFALAFLELLLRETPFWELTFRPDPAAVEFILNESLLTRDS
jgi:hypothetical protein